MSETLGQKAAKRIEASVYDGDRLALSEQDIVAIIDTLDAQRTPASARIYTKCPACGNDTLTINDDKHLLCTWYKCPNPILIDGGWQPQVSAESEEETAQAMTEAISWLEHLGPTFSSESSQDKNWNVREQLTTALDALRRGRVQPGAEQEDGKGQEEC